MAPSPAPPPSRAASSLHRAARSITVALAFVLCACRPDPVRVAADTSDALLRKVTLPSFATGSFVAPGPFARVVMSSRGVEADSAALAASLEARSRGVQALYVLAPPLALDDLEDTRNDIDDALAGSSPPPGIVRLASTVSRLVDLSRRFGPTSPSGPRIDVFADGALRWILVEQVLRRAMRAGVGTVGLGVRNARGAVAVFPYRLQAPGEGWEYRRFDFADEPPAAHPVAVLLRVDPEGYSLEWSAHGSVRADCHSMDPSPGPVLPLVDAAHDVPSIARCIATFLGSMPAPPERGVIGVQADGRVPWSAVLGAVVAAHSSHAGAADGFDRVVLL